MNKWNDFNCTIGAMGFTPDIALNVLKEYARAHPDGAQPPQADNSQSDAICPWCNGSGIRYFGVDVTCRVCEGTGKQHT